MTDHPAPFRCTHCAYDLAGLPADDNTPITCPECAQTTDPFSPRAARVRLINPRVAFVQIFLRAMLPGILFAGSLAVSPILMTALGFIALIFPARMTDRLSEQTITTQRRSVAYAIALGWGFGLFAGATLCILGMMMFIPII